MSADARISEFAPLAGALSTKAHESQLQRLTRLKSTRTRLAAYVSDSKFQCVLNIVLNIVPFVWPWFASFLAYQTILMFALAFSVIIKQVDAVQIECKAQHLPAAAAPAVQPAFSAVSALQHQVELQKLNVNTCAVAASIGDDARTLGSIVSDDASVGVTDSSSMLIAGSELSASSCEHGTGPSGAASAAVSMAEEEVHRPKLPAEEEFSRPRLPPHVGCDGDGGVEVGVSGVVPATATLDSAVSAPEPAAGADGVPAHQLQQSVHPSGDGAADPAEIRVSVNLSALTDAVPSAGAVVVDAAAEAAPQAASLPDSGGVVNAA